MTNCFVLGESAEDMKICPLYLVSEQATGNLIRWQVYQVSKPEKGNIGKNKHDKGEENGEEYIVDLSFLHWLECNHEFHLFFFPHVCQTPLKIQKTVRVSHLTTLVLYFEILFFIFNAFVCYYFSPCYFIGPRTDFLFKWQKMDVLSSWENFGFPFLFLMEWTFQVIVVCNSMCTLTRRQLDVFFLQQVLLFYKRMETIKVLTSMFWISKVYRSKNSALLLIKILMRNVFKVKFLENFLIMQKYRHRILFMILKVMIRVNYAKNSCY